MKVDQKCHTAFYASAHVKRRAFGHGWSRRVPAMVLKELMRHKSVTKTGKYYVAVDTESTAATLVGILNQGDILHETSAGSQPNGVA